MIEAGDSNFQNHTHSNWHMSYVTGDPCGCMRFAVACVLSWALGEDEVESSGEGRKEGLRASRGFGSCGTDRLHGFGLLRGLTYTDSISPKFTKFQKCLMHFRCLWFTRLWFFSLPSSKSDPLAHSAGQQTTQHKHDETSHLVWKPSVLVAATTSWGCEFHRLIIPWVKPFCFLLCSLVLNRLLSNFIVWTLRSFRFGEREGKNLTPPPSSLLSLPPRAISLCFFAWGGEGNKKDTSTRWPTFQSPSVAVLSTGTGRAGMIRWAWLDDA